MRHAVLGVGGVGGLIGGALARHGEDVVLLMRAETFQSYPGHLDVESVVLGDFVVDVAAAAGLDRDVDVVWVATKATQLASALSLIPSAQVAGATVVPLLNGVDHVALLRSMYARVAPGAIRVESERLSPGHIRQSSPFIRLDLVDEGPLLELMRATGFDCRASADELSLLWQKMVFLAPVALATTAQDGPLGTVRHDPRFLRCQEETLAVAAAEGATVDVAALHALLESAPDSMRSSMQRDVDHGHPPELDAIAGPIVRGGRKHGIDTAATARLVELVAARAGQPASVVRT
jgi:2-dehydropantoate 2-reductase